MERLENKYVGPKEADEFLIAHGTTGLNSKVSMAELLKAEGVFLKPRFSPGYGDLPLSMQTDIFRVLDCPRKVGLTLNNSLLMSPSKSVTAIMGIHKTETTEK